MNLRITESKSVALPLGDTPTWGERWESNPRQPEPQSGALPTELRPPYGVPLGIRTPGPRLRRALLYPAELKIHIVKHFIVLLERVPGIEPGYSAWKADILPLNYTRMWSGRRDSNPQLSPWQGDTLPLSHFRKNGGSNWNRTSDTRIFSPLLYRLSYLGLVAGTGFEPVTFGL